jgi:penicillin-binding protein 1C
VTVRRALQLSLNVPAVALLERVGASRLTARLAQAGAPLVLPKGETPGLAMALGGLGVRLTDLTMLYRACARRHVRPRDRAPDRERIRAAPAARSGGGLVCRQCADRHAAAGQRRGRTHRLQDRHELRLSRRLGVGFDGKRTIGVWVGRPDGAPVPGMIGRTAAAPILFDAFARLGQPHAPLAAAPGGALIAPTSQLPPPLQRFSPGGLLSDTGARPLRIDYPPHGAQVELSNGEGVDPLAVKISGGVEPLTVLLNGAPAPVRGARRTLLVEPDGLGFARLTVIDAKGAADSVMVRLQ